MGCCPAAGATSGRVLHGGEEAAAGGAAWAGRGREEMRHEEAYLVGDELDLVGEDGIAAVAARSYEASSGYTEG